MSQSSRTQNFASSQPVRWCPGCGDYAILKGLQKIFAELDIARENIALVSGIGCSGRLPFYMNTYGLHGLHGRASAIATGLKLSRPELSVWMITGDGDGLSIGAGNLYHLLRRDININILLLNNQIYGLTKGQFSPTSQPGQITATSPYGVQETPTDPIQFALAAGASFVARALDVDMPGFTQVLRQAAQHPGVSFIEIKQNCPVFNDHAFDTVRDKTQRPANMLWLSDGEPLCYGKDNEKGIKLTEMGAECIDCSEQDAITQVSKHQADRQSIIPAWRLTELQQPEFPIPFGVFRKVVSKPYGQRLDSKRALTVDEVGKVFYQGSTWRISPNPAPRQSQEPR